MKGLVNDGNILKYELKKFIGPAIRKIRKQKGFSQEKLSLEARKNNKYISGIETGDVENITIYTLRDVSYALQIKPSKLVSVAQKLERDSLYKDKVKK